MIRFHFKEFLTVICPSPKNSGAVTAAEGTREAKFAIIQSVMVTATLLTPVLASAGMQMLKKRIIATVLETKLVKTRHRK